MVSKTTPIGPSELEFDLNHNKSAGWRCKGDHAMTSYSTKRIPACILCRVSSYANDSCLKARSAMQLENLSGCTRTLRNLHCHLFSGNYMSSHSNIKLAVFSVQPVIYWACNAPAMKTHLKALRTVASFNMPPSPSSAKAFSGSSLA